MYRYKVDDDFGLPSSAFTISAFGLTRVLLNFNNEVNKNCSMMSINKFSLM